MIILGIETSCDETAVGVVDDSGNILANVVLSQMKEHESFGGVVPEIAARAHLDHIDTLIAKAMEDSGLQWHDLDGIAATCGPGLIGGVMVGMMAGKTLSAALDKDFIAVNHLEAHILTPRLEKQISFPYLVLLVSGGHTQILIAHDIGHYECIGETQDDALGECFDKSARLMGLPYPGGAYIEKRALQCKDPAKAIDSYPLPKPMVGRKGCDFSFSGLKTAMRKHIDAFPDGPLEDDVIADLSYALQNTVKDILENRIRSAIKIFNEKTGKSSGDFVISGGVAANSIIRENLKDLTEACNMTFNAPSKELCTDNGVMIAWAGLERLKRHMTDTLDFKAKPRWPLTEMQKAS